MPVLFSSLNEEDHAWHSHVLLMFVGYNSFAAQNIKNLFMVVSVHLCSGPCGKGYDSSLDFLCTKLLVYERLRVDAPTFKDAAKSIFRWNIIQLNRFQHHQALHLLFAGLVKAWWCAFFGPEGIVLYTAQVDSILIVVVIEQNLTYPLGRLHALAKN